MTRNTDPDLGGAPDNLVVQLREVVSRNQHVDTRIELLQQRMTKLEPVETDVRELRERVVSQDKDLELLKKLIYPARAARRWRARPRAPPRTSSPSSSPSGR